MAWAFGSGNRVLIVHARVFRPPSCLILAARLPAADRPNFLVLVADDPGRTGSPRWAIRSCKPRTSTRSRRAASLPHARLLLLPICVVSRTEMMTGPSPLGRDGGTAVLSGGQTTWPEAFREACYETWHVGKWHVSGRPSQRGYTRLQHYTTRGLVRRRRGKILEVRPDRPPRCAGDGLHRLDFPE